MKTRSASKLALPRRSKRLQERKEKEKVTSIVLSKVAPRSRPAAKKPKKEAKRCVPTKSQPGVLTPGRKEKINRFLRMFESGENKRFGYYASEYWILSLIAHMEEERRWEVTPDDVKRWIATERFFQNKNRKYGHNVSSQSASVGSPQSQTSCQSSTNSTLFEPIKRTRTRKAVEGKRKVSFFGVLNDDKGREAEAGTSRSGNAVSTQVLVELNQPDTVEDKGQNDEPAGEGQGEQGNFHQYRIQLELWQPEPEYLPRQHEQQQEQQRNSPPASSQPPNQPSGTEVEILPISRTLLPDPSAAGASATNQLVGIGIEEASAAPSSPLGAGAAAEDEPAPFSVDNPPNTLEEWKMYTDWVKRVLLRERNKRSAIIDGAVFDGLFNCASLTGAFLDLAIRNSFS
ncbi:unnamed protein product [Orchesella dallaii]|uniref:Uncharacterized protein n=1 Tax=Orchesella dallaii TaxID=48710 RepID=A0ABP1PL87_9HEXA